VTPFVIDFANIMNPIAANEAEQQWIIDKHKPRRWKRWFGYPSGSAAPEPSGWLLLMIGFGLIGALIRRRRAILKPVN